LGRIRNRIAKIQIFAAPLTPLMRDLSNAFLVPRDEIEGSG
jgi:hypothetical protein